MEELIKRAKKIKAILTDVDGILTDGKVNFFVTPEGKIDEFKSFNTQDGIITGRRHPTTVERARNLGYKYIYQGFLTKTGPLKDILTREGLTAEEVAYIGDDITDMPLLKRVGFAATVPNALDCVKACSHYVTKRAGGDGAYREIIDFILNAQGKLAPQIEQMDRSEWKAGPKAEMEIITSQEGIA